jgi:hypothetical protein
MSKDTFETLVLEKLTAIESRLETIESRFDEATNFASSMLEDDSGLLGSLDLGTIRDVMASFAPPSADTPLESGDILSEQESLTNLATALQGFREQLTGIKESILLDPESFVPDESAD